MPLLLLYTNRWQCCGWNSAAVITSVRSSILAGLMSTMSEKGRGQGKLLIYSSESCSSLFQIPNSFIHSHECRFSVNNGLNFDLSGHKRVILTTFMIFLFW